jgi:hypothetical protein
MLSLHQAVPRRNSRTILLFPRGIQSNGLKSNRSSPNTAKNDLFAVQALKAERLRLFAQFARADSRSHFPHFATLKEIASHFSKAANSMRERRDARRENSLHANAHDSPRCFWQLALPPLCRVSLVKSAGAINWLPLAKRWTFFLRTRRKITMRPKL